MTNADIIKGYEYEKGKYVVMTDEDLEKIKTKKDKTIHIIQFARMAEVNMIYYEKDYYAVPDTGKESSSPDTLPPLPAISPLYTRTQNKRRSRNANLPDNGRRPDIPL